ncbi:MAG: hypothetical protein OQJ77_06945, partial [Thiovulaceae bacterium]|nr:hypothetical protein [Sulfurimonadaceae bacterium]
KKTLQSFISKTTNKNVHIKNVNVSLKNGTLDINDLNIFKNGVSSFNAREISAKIDFNQLLFNRYHIMNLEIKGMEFNQATDAKVKVEKKGTKEHTDSKMTSFNFDTSSIIKPQELISNMELSSSKNYKKALNDFEGIENKYKNAIENDFSKEELENIKSEIDKIKLQLKEIKKIKKLKLTHLELISNSLDDIEKLRKKLKEKRKKLKQLKQEFKEDKKSLINFSNDIVKGANTDYENLSQNYRFNKEGGVNVVGVLFGKTIKEYLSSFLTYYELIKPYLKKEQELASPKRGEGRWIRYKELNSQVDVLVKNIDIDGLYESNKFIANIKNASSNQILLNMPIVLKIKSEGKLSKNIDFGLAKLKSANYIIDAEAKTLDYDTISADAKMNYFKTKFSSEKLKSIKEFYIDIKLSKKISSPHIMVKSDLDNKLRDIFQKTIKEQLAKYKDKLKKLIDTKMQSELKKLGLKSSEISKLEKLLGASLDDFSRTDKLLNKYEKELKSESKDRAKEKVKEKVGDLLKSFKF